MEIAVGISWLVVYRGGILSFEMLRLISRKGRSPSSVYGMSRL